MNEPQTLEDHAQLFLNLYRGRVPLTSADWKYLEAWAVRVLGPRGSSSDIQHLSSKGKT